jgi:type III secretion system low calcium response chaperone LcrH/SycD
MNPSEEDIFLSDEMIAGALQLGAAHADSANKNLCQVVDDVLNKGMVPQDAVGISDTTTENLYNRAYQLYQGGKYTDALHHFRTLILMRATDMRFAFGLASCFHMLKTYEQAAEAYINCTLVDAKDPLPFYHASDCYIQMDNSGAAALMLNMAISRAGDQKRYQELKKQALLALEALTVKGNR